MASQGKKHPLTPQKPAAKNVDSFAKKKLPPTPEGERKKKGKKQRSNGSTETFKSYILRILKQVHPDVGISGKAMEIMNNFITDIFDRLASEACKLAMHSKKNTITAREIQTAARLMLPGELGKHGVFEATEAVIKFTSD